MKPLNEQEAKAAKKLLFSCAEVLPEGFRIDLSENPDGWAGLTRAVGAGRLCAFIASALSQAYQKRFSEPFLFSERCMAFELRYHLDAYLCVKGLYPRRHISTLLFSKAVIERKCRSIEIDKNDVYRLSQRIAFHYFFGITRVFLRTARDPYAIRLFGRYVRVPFYRMRG